MKLPQVTSEPLDRAAQFARLGGARQWFLETLIGEAPIFHLQKTNTRIDVGSWFRKPQIWACVTDQKLVLFAAGDRPYAEQIPLDELQQSEYNHVTGEIVLAPVESLQVNRLKLPPILGLQVLSHICRGDEENESA